MNVFKICQNTHLERVSDGAIAPILSNVAAPDRLLILVWPQLGDFDSLEYAWWLQQEPELLKDVTVVAVGIGNRASGTKFCNFTGFAVDQLYMTAEPKLHQQLELYAGLALKLPGLSAAQNAWLNLMVMCAGIGSPGTLKEVFRGYKGS